MKVAITSAVIENPSTNRRLRWLVHISDGQLLAEQAILWNFVAPIYSPHDDSLKHLEQTQYNLIQSDEIAVF